MTGLLKGHDSNGNALIITQFGNPLTKPFSEIRLVDPYSARKPNWHYLPARGQIVRPDADILARFQTLLAQPIPPGPTYLDLAKEVWGRGFEIFLVGGTVRDILGGLQSHDVDFVTTMPLAHLRQFLRPMYRYEPSAVPTRGFIRVGGKPASGDPFFDLKVFSDSLPGTQDATFGSDFARDVAHRDFACNAIYYDPLNQVLLDPTGIGIEDASNRVLSIICKSGDRFQHAQIMIRAIKFLMRGFQPSNSTLEFLRAELRQSIPTMRSHVRVAYVQAQLLSKYPKKTEHPQVLGEFRATLVSLGFEDVWIEYFQPVEEGILA